MTMRRAFLFAAVAAILAAGATAPALADPHGWHDHGWHDQDIHHFHDHDFDRWRGGQWYHGWHDGRFAWWWQVGPVWYPYPRPIYPYPDPYVPPYAAPGAPAWYYCPTARAYYPYVPTCPVPWQIVPAQ
jgi:hypothetical protein